MSKHVQIGCVIHCNTLFANSGLSVSWRERIRITVTPWRWQEKRCNIVNFCYLILRSQKVQKSKYERIVVMWRYWCLVRGGIDVCKSALLDANFGLGIPIRKPGIKATTSDCHTQTLLLLFYFHVTQDHTMCIHLLSLSSSLPSWVLGSCWLIGQQHDHCHNYHYHRCHNQHHHHSHHQSRE